MPHRQCPVLKTLAGINMGAGQSVYSSMTADKTHVVLIQEATRTDHRFQCRVSSARFMMPGDKLNSLCILGAVKCNTGVITHGQPTPLSARPTLIPFNTCLSTYS